VFGDVLAVVRDALGASEDDQATGAVDPIGEVSQRAGRLVIKTLAAAGGLAALSGAHEAVSAHHGNNYAPLVERFYRSHRPALFTLLDAVVLEPTSTDRRVADDRPSCLGLVRGSEVLRQLWRSRLATIL